MPHTWFVSFAIAAAVSAGAVPLLRRFAVMTDFLDLPASHKSHAKPVPYLGGVAIFLGAGIAIFATSHQHYSLVTAASALALLGIGLIDDRRGIPPIVKLGVQSACAVAVCVLSFHLQTTGGSLALTGVAVVNLVFTIPIFVLMPNSINLMDNTDGLAAGVVAVTAACLMALTALHGIPVEAERTAAVSGACLGFLLFNKAPASIYMGDAGSLPLGFMLAAMAVRAGSVEPAPVGAEVTFLFLAIPIADTVTVAVSRVLHHRSIFQGGQDHLSHRLAKAGMSISIATLVLIAASGLLGVLGVGIVLRHIPAWLALIAGGVVVGGIVAAATRPEISRAIYEVA